MNKDIDVTKLTKYECPMPLREFDVLHQQRALQYYDAEVLCTLIKEFKPSDILELGTFTGLSSKVMSMAVRENGFGKITSVDLWGPGESFAGPNSPCRGELLNDKDLEIITQITADEIFYLEKLPEASFDMIFEDTNHAARMLEVAIPQIERVLRPGGIALFHNSNWESVQLGMDMAGVEDRIFYLNEISLCNIIMLRKENNHE